MFALLDAQVACRAWDVEAGQKAATQPGRAVGRLDADKGDGAQKRVAFRADARCLGLVLSSGGVMGSWSGSGAVYVAAWQGSSRS